MEILIQYQRGQYRILSDGKVRRYAADYGEIIGTKGADGEPIDVYRGLFQQAETAFIINQYHDNGAFDEHKIMLNFYDEAQAKSAYELTCEKSVREIFACTSSRLEWWLQYGNHKKPVTYQSFPFDSENHNMTQAAALNWGNESQTAAQLIYDWRKTDTYGELTEPATLDSILYDELADGAEIQEAVFDALVVENKRLERTAQLLGNAFNRASGSLKVVENGIQISAPMRKNGTTNIAVMFEMTDGQVITVMLHNPDTTPAKIAPDDMLVSWKWLLNRKDITIVVAKENGQDLPLPIVARRVMALVEKNTARFAKANANKAAETETLARLEAEKAEKLARLEELNAMIAARENNDEAQDETQSENTENPSLETFDDEDDLRDYLETNGYRYKGGLYWRKFNKADKSEILVSVNGNLVKTQRLQSQQITHDRIVGFPFNKEQFIQDLQELENKTKSQVRIMRYRDVFSVKVPFDLKDDFKRAVKGVKWQPETKEWFVPIEQEAALKAWAYDNQNQDENTDEIDDNSGNMNSGSLNDENQEIDINTIKTNISDYTQQGDKDLTAAVRRFVGAMRDKFVHTTALGKVYFGKKSVGSLGKGTHDELRAKLVLHVPNTLKTGHYVGREELKYNRHDSFVAFHKFKGTAIVDNQEIEHIVKVGETPSGKYEFIAYYSRQDDGVMDTANPNASCSGIARAALGLVPTFQLCSHLVSGDDTLPKSNNNVNGVFDDISDGQDGWNIEIISIREIGDDSNELDDLIENNGTDETDENIGRIWQTVDNDEIVQREIIGKETDLAFVEPLRNRFPNLSGEIYLVQQGNNTMKMPVELLDKVIGDDQANVKRKQADDEYTQQYANQKAEQEAAENAKKAKLTAFLNTISDSKVKGLAQKTLEKEINTHELGVTQRYLWIENLIENQLKPEMKEVSAIKEVSRTRYNRMSADEQAEYEKRLAEKKMAYFMTGVSGSYGVSKFEYEFAMFLTNSGSLNNEDEPLETPTNPNDEINNLARIADEVFEKLIANGIADPNGGYNKMVLNIGLNSFLKKESEEYIQLQQNLLLANNDKSYIALLVFDREHGGNDIMEERFLLKDQTSNELVEKISVAVKKYLPHLQPKTPTETNPAKQQAIDYLNDVINGKIDGMADGVVERMIELSEPFDDDPEILDLINQATVVIENAMPKDI